MCKGVKRLLYQDSKEEIEYVVLVVHVLLRYIDSCSFDYMRVDDVETLS